MPDQKVIDGDTVSSGKAERPVLTVGQSLDNKIKRARQRVQDLCVAKAKAEALGMLDYPQDFIDDLSYGM